MPDVPKAIREKYPHHRPEFIMKKEAKNVKQIDASYESENEWCQDPVGYFVIKVFYDDGYFGARFHENDGTPKVDIIGTDAEEIVQTVVREKLVSSLQHAAYLGHELHKAEIALAFRLNFVQDSDLDFEKKTEKKESDNLPE
ncbi:MAG: DUF4346 domain-containing protein [Candidatus Woesearchaeota archaeon]|nr:DUF4346 domain-containing protein [Candidatus Woesearchaeota archaeon]